jgi:sporulation protein YlmC with PRC-barrel domain
MNRQRWIKTIAAMAALSAAIAASGEDLFNAPQAPALRGAEVRNNRDQRVGCIDDVVLDPASGRVLYVVLSVGDFVGVPDRCAAVPPGAFTRPNGQLRIDADRQKLLDAPVCTQPGDRRPEFVSKVYSYFDPSDRLQPTANSRSRERIYHEPGEK